jgi:hypothetical protein
LGDVGDDWKSPADAAQALDKAYAAGKMDEVGNIYTAMFDRNMILRAIPAIDRMFQQRLDKALEDRLSGVLPHVQESIAQRETVEAQAFALEQLETVKGFEDIRQLQVPEEGPDVVIEGTKFKNTPLNRAIAANPEILSIYVPETDERVIAEAKRTGETPRQIATRLSMLYRFRAAARAHKTGQVDGAKAKQLMEAGARASERKGGEKFRQGLNAGPGASQSSATGQGGLLGRPMQLSDIP